LLFISDFYFEFFLAALGFYEYIIDLSCTTSSLKSPKIDFLKDASLQTIIGKSSNEIFEESFS